MTAPIPQCRSISQAHQIRPWHTGTPHCRLAASISPLGASTTHLPVPAHPTCAFHPNQQALLPPSFSFFLFARSHPSPVLTQNRLAETLLLKKTLRRDLRIDRPGPVACDRDGKPTWRSPRARAPPSATCILLTRPVRALAVQQMCMAVTVAPLCPLPP